MKCKSSRSNHTSNSRSDRYAVAFLTMVDHLDPDNPPLVELVIALDPHRRSRWQHFIRFTPERNRQLSRKASRSFSSSICKPRQPKTLLKQIVQLQHLALLLQVLACHLEAAPTTPSRFPGQDTVTRFCTLPTVVSERPRLHQACLVGCTFAMSQERELTDYDLFLRIAHLNDWVSSLGDLAQQLPEIELLKDRLTDGKYHEQSVPAYLRDHEDRKGASPLHQ